MAINAGDLIINVKANLNDFRRGMGQTVALTKDMAARLATFSQRTQTIGGTGFGGFGDPTGQAKGFIDASRAMKIYETDVNSLVQDLQGFSATLVKVQAPLFSLHRTTTDLVPVTREASAATKEHAVRLGYTSAALAKVGPATSLAAAGFGGMVSRATFLTSTLRRLDLINYNVFKSFSSWNTLDVLAGPGKIVTAFDRMKVAIAGGTAPVRALQFAVGLAIPVLQSFGQAMIRNAQDDASKKAGASILKLADDIKGLGSGYTPRPLLAGVNAIKAGFAGLQTVAQKTNAVLTPAIQGAGKSIALLATARSLKDVALAFAEGNGAGLRFFATLGKATITKTFSAAVRLGDIALVQLGRSVLLATRALSALASAATRPIWSPFVAGARAAYGAVVTLGQRLGFLKSQADGVSGSANRAADSFGKLGIAGKAAQGASFGLSQLGPGISTLASLGLAAGAAFGVVTTALEGINSAIDFEQTELAFTTMIGDAEKAKKTLSELTTFSDVTPFEPGPVIEAGRFLVTAGVAAEDLRSTLTRIGDVASGVGAPIEDIAQKWARVKNENRLTGEILTQFGERGIPVAQELARMYGVTQAEVRDLAEKGRIGIDALDAAFKNLSGSGGKFENLMSKQAQTVGGLLSTMAGKSKLALRDLGQGLLDAVNFKGILQGFIYLQDAGGSAFRDRLLGAVKFFADGVASIAVPVMGFLRENFELVKSVGSAAWQAVGEVATSAWQLILDAASVVGDYVGSVFKNIFGSGAVSSFKSFKDFAVDALVLVEFAFKNWKEIATLAAYGVALSVVRTANQIGYFFGKVVPAYVAFFRDNWRDIFTDVVNFTKTTFTNLYDNITSFFSEAWDYISSGGATSFEFNWTPLTEGFTSALKELPQIADREIGGLEAQLTGEVAGMQTALTTQAADYLNERKKQLGELKEQANAGPAGLEKPTLAGDQNKAEAPGLLADKSKKSNQRDKSNLVAAEAGSSEAYRLIAEATRGQAIVAKDKRLERINREQLEELKRIADALNEQRKKTTTAVKL